MFGLPTDIMMSILRHFLSIIGGIIIAKGWLTADVMGQLTGGIVAVVPVLFAAFFHAQSNGAIPTISTTSNLVLQPSAQIPTGVAVVS